MKTIKVRLVNNIVGVCAVLAAIFLTLTLGYVVITMRGELSDNVVGAISAETRRDAARVELLIEEVQSVTRSLRTTPPIQGLIRADNPQNYDSLDNSTRDQWRRRLEAIFSGVIDSSNYYLQLRYIDDEGVEVVRVDDRDGKVVVVSKNDLQNKSDRPYFKEANRLKEGEMYVSQTELNREGTPPVISEPAVAVIRFATPVFDERNGDRKGVIVANVKVDSLINDVSISKTGLQTYMMNNTWSFMLNPDEKKEWGGELDHNTGINFFTEFPNINEDDLSSEVGNSFIRDGDIYIYQRIRPDPKNQNRMWTILHRVSQNEVFVEFVDMIRDVAVVGALVFVLLLVVFYLAVSRILRVFEIVDPRGEATKFSLNEEENELSRKVKQIIKEEKIINTETPKDEEQG